MWLKLNYIDRKEKASQSLNSIWKKACLIPHLNLNHMHLDIMEFLHCHTLIFFKKHKFYLCKLTSGIDLPLTVLGNG